MEYQQSKTQFNNLLLTVKGHIDGSMQNKYNSNVNTLEPCLPRTKPSIWESQKCF